jgi:preprotein translocase subunit SecD
MSRYELGASAGELTVTRAVIANEFKGVATNTPLVVVQFDAVGTMTFSAVTKANVGKQLAFLVGGRVVMAPMIREPITDGMAALTLDRFTPAALKQLEARLNAR